MFTTELHCYLRALMGSDAVRVGPFLLGLDAHDAGLFRNYAVPDDDAHPSPSDVAALIHAFEQRDRIPRLEYLPDCAPDVQATLHAAGFTLERRLPVLTCEPSAAVAPAISGVRLRLAHTTDDLARVAAAQNDAYASGVPTEHDIDRLRGTLAGGGLVSLAELDTDDPSQHVLGAGLCAPPHHGISELAGVGVRAAYRRRGIAAAVTAHLTRHCRDVGIVHPFLTPVGPDEERIYTRVGYRRRADMIHISLPTSDAP